MHAGMLFVGACHDIKSRSVQCCHVNGKYGLRQTQIANQSKLRMHQMSGSCYFPRYHCENKTRLRCVSLVNTPAVVLDFMKRS